jgi:hypothetical protein
MRLPYISLAAAGALALGGCAYGDLGLGMGYGSPYYGSSYGYGSPYYGYGYGSPYYGGYGYGSSYYGGLGYGSYYGGFGSPYFGWYDNYYYPGSGYYVYDTYRRPHVMTTTQRQYWASRSPTLRTSTTTTRVQPNWSGFNRRTSTYTARQTAREERQTAREERKLERQTRRKSKDD